MTDCNICCEKLNNSNRKEVTCVFCDYVICRTCFQRYITETSLDPHCMSCKKDFNHDFVVANCTSAFITKDLKKHRENILLQREKSLLPETQPYVVIEHQRRDLNKVIRDLNDKKYELRRQQMLIDRDINDIQSQVNRLSITNTPIEERKKFIRKCPLENCRGFLSTQWKCGSCEKRICKECNEEKVDEDHICIPENVASMELLNKDSKPCPNCGTVIFKISGCSQMFCTDCHTPWDWNTQRIVSGVIHNPHYYEFTQRGGRTAGRNNGDIPCGGLPDIYQLRTAVHGRTDTSYFFSIHQCITHIQHHELRHHIVDNVIETNRDYRVKYLMNDLSEEEFKAILQQNEKKRRKTIAFRTIYEMFVNVGSDILRQVVIDCSAITSKSQLREALKEHTNILVNLTNYFNENLKGIGKTYKCVYPGIATNTTFANNLETMNTRLENARIQNVRV